MAQFMLLLYDDPTHYEGLSPEALQKIAERYHAWGEGLAARGKLLSSNKLEDGSGRVLRHSADGVRILDGPYSETKEVIGGYFLLEAADYDEAVELVRDCPHLEREGAAELRAIEALELD